LDFRPVYEFIPNIIVQTAIMSFVFAVVLFGIFRKKNRQPVDLQEALEFAQSKAKARKDGTTDVTLDDVAGLDSVKHQFEEIVTFLKQPDQFKGSGVRPPKGVLLEGPPGTGKTLIAKAIAGEASVGFYQMSGSEFVEAIVGVGAARVRDLFKRARAYEDPILIFVDEIDALALARASGGEQANEEREQVGQTLGAIAGVSPSAAVSLLAHGARTATGAACTCTATALLRRLRAEHGGALTLLRGV
jgi:cell division protease FtsH